MGLTYTVIAVAAAVGGLCSEVAACSDLCGLNMQLHGIWPPTALKLDSPEVMIFEL